MGRYNVAVVGAGAVGEEMLNVLAQRNFPVNELKVLARSAREIEVNGRKYDVRPTVNEEFENVMVLCDSACPIETVFGVCSRRRSFPVAPV